ncbi:uncharacterized protein V1478_001608 [Vespula squamosa]|uniref:Uncharacterized protein n=1 Tax=Vespula squamosa TaxID=30214 RepID=A0ABD2C1Y1_VESSQ
MASDRWGSVTLRVQMLTEEQRKINLINSKINIPMLFIDIMILCIAYERCDRGSVTVNPICTCPHLYRLWRLSKSLSPHLSSMEDQNKRHTSNDDYVNLTNVMLSADRATGDVKVKRGVWQAK